MVEFADRDALEGWLEDRPREAAIAIAARAALRALPALTDVLDDEAESRRANIILPVFRAAAVSRVAAVGPTKVAEVAAAARAAAAATRAATASRAAFAAAHAAYTAADAAHAAARAAHAAGFAAADAARAAGDAALTAGFAARADTGAADSAAARVAVSVDATALGQGRSVEELMAAPLWPDDPPETIAEAWSALSAHLVAADEDWEVWTEWYEDCLHGRRFHKALEEARVLIDDALWEQGPKAVNAEIRRLIDEHKITGTADVTLPGIIAAATGTASGTGTAEAAGSAEVGLPARVEAALTSVELRAALADFELDDLARLMRMVPFTEDIKQLHDPALERDRASKLSELSDLAADLARDIKTAKRNVPEALRSDLNRYAGEAARGPASVRPGRLWDFGLLFAGALKDEDIAHGLGSYLSAKLERLVDKHLDLMRDYFAATLARMRSLDSIEPAPDATPEAVIDALDRAVQGLDSDDWGDVPPPDPEIPAVLADRVEELRNLLDRIHRTTDARKRDDLESTFWRKAKAAAMTVMRYGVRSYREATMALGGAAAVKTFWPESFASALQMIRNLFENVPWPF